MGLNARIYDGEDVMDSVGDDVAAAIASLEGEIQQVAHWMDDAFGAIEADAARFTPFLVHVTRPVRGTLAFGAALISRMTPAQHRPRLTSR